MPDDARDTALAHVESLIRRGDELQQRLSADSTAAADVDEMRGWQQQVAAAVTHLSGGSKAHWLSRAFSDALLVRSIDGGAVVEAPAHDIVHRLVEVLVRARASLQQMHEPLGFDASRFGGDETPPRFRFVYRRELHPILEQAYADSRAAFDRGDFGEALVLTCSVLEAVVTDALEHANSVIHGEAALAHIADMSFDARIAASERAGLIRGGCARLPSIALRYRDYLDASGSLDDSVIVLPREARTAAQVLRVVMRDLDPGR